MSSQDVMNLISKRTQFLKEHPELVSTQEVIDQKLKKAGSNPLNRCIVIQNLMIDEAKKLLSANKAMYKDIAEMSRLVKEDSHDGV